MFAPQVAKPPKRLAGFGSTPAARSFAGEPTGQAPPRSKGASRESQPSPAGFDFSRLPVFPHSLHGKPAGPDDRTVKGNGGPASAPQTAAPSASPPSTAPTAAGTTAGGAGVAAVPASGGGTQALSFSTVRGPTPVQCGAYEWVIQWQLAQKSAAGGHAVQHLAAAYDIKDAAGKDVTVATMGQAKWDYWEAWPFNANQSVTTFAQGGDKEDDTYVDKDMGSTKGSIVVTGDAKFHEGLNTLPAVFKKNNPATQAGILASSTTDPNLTGGTANVAHNLKVEWDCTAAKSATKIVSHS